MSYAYMNEKGSRTELNRVSLDPFPVMLSYRLLCMQTKRN